MSNHRHKRILTPVLLAKEMTFICPEAPSGSHNPWEFPKGIKAWDVVNEALNEDATLRRSRWYQIIGEDYIAKAFEYAHEADPDAELRYNDFSIENEPKRKGTIALVKKLQAQNIPIRGLGSQTHANLTWPEPELLDSALTDFAQLGFPISITELDVDASEHGQRRQSAEVSENAQAGPGGGGVVTSANQKLAGQYSSLFRIFLKHRKNIKLVTFWGVTDRDSWRSFGNPLLFDREGKPKKCFDAVVHTTVETHAQPVERTNKPWKTLRASF